MTLICIGVTQYRHDTKVYDEALDDFADDDFM